MRDQLKTERCQVFRCFFLSPLNFFIRVIISFLSRISFAYCSFRYLFFILLIFLIYYLSKSPFDLVGSSRAKHIGRADDQCRRSWVDESLFFFFLDYIVLDVEVPTANESSRLTCSSSSPSPINSHRVLLSLGQHPAIVSDLVN